jgi:hypothetical protein
MDRTFLVSSFYKFHINLPLSKTIGFLGMGSGHIWYIRRLFFQVHDFLLSAYKFLTHLPHISVDHVFERVKSLIDSVGDLVPVVLVIWSFDLAEVQ